MNLNPNNDARDDEDDEAVSASLRTSSAGSRARGARPDLAAAGSKHQWVLAQLRALIATLNDDDALPTERDLQARFAVSRTTVRKALTALSESGQVYRIQGAGTFVASTRVSKTMSLTSFSEDMTVRGWKPSSTLTSFDSLPAGPELARELQIDPCEQVHRIVRVRLADRQPMCLETVFLPAVMAPSLDAGSLEGSLYEYLGQFGVRPVRAEQVVRAISVSGVEASLLKVPQGSPALEVRRLGLDQRGKPIEKTVSLYRADRYDLAFNVKRDTQ